MVCTFVPQALVDAHKLQAAMRKFPTDRMQSEEALASFDAPAAAGCLQSIIGVLHPELKRFVWNCIKEHVLDEDEEREHARIDAQVAAILDSKLSALTKQRDFAAYLALILTHWNAYFEYTCGSFYELRAIAQSVLRFRNCVAHQIELTEDDFDTAIDIFARFAVFIHASKSARSKIRTCIAALDMGMTSASLPLTCMQEARPHGKFVLSKQLERTLCPKLKKFVRDAVTNSVFRAKPIELTPSNVENLEDQVSRILRSELQEHAARHGSEFAAHLAFIDSSWNADFTFLWAYPELRDVAKQVLHYYQRFLITQTEMETHAFEDAMDAFSRLAILIRASQSTAQKLQALFRDSEPRHATVEEDRLTATIQVSVAQKIWTLNENPSERNHLLVVFLMLLVLVHTFV